MSVGPNLAYHSLMGTAYRPLFILYPLELKSVFPLEKLHPVDIPAGQNDLGIEEGQFEKEANGLINAGSSPRMWGTHLLN